MIQFHRKEAIQAIVKAIDIPSELGGGIRDMQTIEAYLGLGIDRVILGVAYVALVLTMVWSQYRIEDIADENRQTECELARVDLQATVVLMVEEGVDLTAGSVIARAIATTSQFIEEELCDGA